MTKSKDGIYFEFEGYKGYPMRRGFEKTFHGEVLDIKDVVTFQGNTILDAYDGFVDSVDDYLEMCKERGEEPEQPNKPDKPDKAEQSAEKDFVHRGYRGTATWHAGGSSGVGYYTGEFMTRAFSGLSYLTTLAEFANVVNEYISRAPFGQGKPQQSTMYDKHQTDINRILETTKFSYADGDYVYSTIEEIIKGIAHSLALDRSVVEFHLGSERVAEIEQKIKEAKASAPSRTHVNPLTTALTDLENMMSQLEKARSEVVAAKQDIVFINRDIVRLLVDNNMDYLLRANWHEIDKVLDKEGNNET